MNKRRLLLVSTTAVVCGINCMLWLLSDGLRDQGQMYHATKAADSVIAELKERQLLIDTTDMNERQLYWDAVANPIRTHIDPHESADKVTLVFNAASLGLILLLLLLPERKKVEPVH